MCTKKTIKFQLIDPKTHEPLTGKIYECEVDAEVMLGHAIPLRPTKDSVIRVADIVMRPCRICKVTGDTDLLEYVLPEGKGWSDVPFFELVKIVEE